MNKNDVEVYCEIVHSDHWGGYPFRPGNATVSDTACAYNSTGRKYAPISELCLIPNDIPRIRSALQFKLQLFFHSVGSEMAQFLEEDCSA